MDHRAGALSTSPPAVNNMGGAIYDIAQILADYGVGIDCHSRFIQVCVLAKAEANIIRFDREYKTTWNDLCEAREWVTETLASVLADRFEGRVLAYTLESTGCYHLPVILAFGGDPSVVNPLLANPSRRKTDKLDARLLAHHAIIGMWPTSFLCPPDIQGARIAIMHRSRLVAERTRQRNTLNNIVLRFGHTCGAYYRPSTAAGYAILEDLADGKLTAMDGVSPIPIPGEVRKVMKIYIDRIAELNAEVKDANNHMLATTKAAEYGTGGGELCSGEVLLPLLMTCPGVGELAACTSYTTPLSIPLKH